MAEQNLSNEDFAAIWNDVETYPLLRDVSDATGYTPSYVKNKAFRLRAAYKAGKKVPKLVDRSEAPEAHSPLPELQYEYRERMTQKELIEALRKLHFSDPERTITRNYFRIKTGISDATWNRYFGTFLEFKRQAGLEMTRHQHTVERQIAKHVAADHYREFNKRHDYSDRYLKPRNRKIKTIVGCSDLHDIEVDPFYLRVLIEACRLIQPDVINFGGDIFDLPEFGKYGVDPREWDVVGRIRWVHDNIFKPLREACPNSQFDFIEGNHEFRLLRHLADATPALKAVLSDLLGLTVPKLLGLDEFEINYIARGDLAAFNKRDQLREVEKSYVVYDDALLVHHHPHASDWGLPGWNGHHHAWKVINKKHALRGAYQWTQLGCGHRLSASYTEGEFWSLNFIVAHINTETGTVTKEPINITDIACVGGIFFVREPYEMVGAFAKKGSAPSGEPSFAV